MCISLAPHGHWHAYCFITPNEITNGKIKAIFLTPTPNSPNNSNRFSPSTRSIGAGGVFYTGLDARQRPDAGFQHALVV